MKTKFFSEFIGIAFLLMIIVGSGIMGEKLSGGNDGIALLANSLATGAGLFVLIQSAGPLSGAHFNPAVSFIEFLWRRLSMKEMLSFITAQLIGGILGVFAVHTMFNQPIIQTSEKARNGFHLAFSEFVATFGLISVIALAGRKRVEWVPLAVALYITSAYWFTSSTSFANPAVTLARSLTNTFCGIAASSTWAFFVAQILGATAAFLVVKRIDDKRSEECEYDV